MERIAEQEVERITAKCQRCQGQGKQIPRWVRAGMDERFRRVEQVEQRVQMLLGIFASHDVLPLEFKPAYSVGDLLLQHLDALEQEAEEKGGVQQVLADHFAKVYKVSMPLAPAACPAKAPQSDRRKQLFHGSLWVTAPKPSRLIATSGQTLVECEAVVDLYPDRAKQGQSSWLLVWGTTQLTTSPAVGRLSVRRRIRDRQSRMSALLSASRSAAAGDTPAAEPGC
jgi:hypothetical protein